MIYAETYYCLHSGVVILNGDAVVINLTLLNNHHDKKLSLLFMEWKDV